MLNRRNALTSFSFACWFLALSFLPLPSQDPLTKGVGVGGGGGKPLSLTQNPCIAVSQGWVLRVHESHTTHRARHEGPSSRAAARPAALGL